MSSTGGRRFASGSRLFVAIAAVGVVVVGVVGVVVVVVVFETGVASIMIVIDHGSYSLLVTGYFGTPRTTVVVVAVAVGIVI